MSRALRWLLAGVAVAIVAFEGRIVLVSAMNPDGGAYAAPLLLLLAPFTAGALTVAGVALFRRCCVRRLETL